MRKAKAQATVSTAPAAPAPAAPATGAPSLEEVLGLLKALVDRLGAAPVAPAAEAPAPKATEASKASEASGAPEAPAAPDFGPAKAILRRALKALDRQGFGIISFVAILSKEGRARKMWHFGGDILDKEDIAANTAPAAPEAPAPKARKARKGAKAVLEDEAMARALDRAMALGGPELAGIVNRRAKALRENAPAALLGYLTFVAGAKAGDIRQIKAGWKDLADKFGG